MNLSAIEGTQLYETRVPCKISHITQFLSNQVFHRGILLDNFRTKTFCYIF